MTPDIEPALKLANFIIAVRADEGATMLPTNSELLLAQAVYALHAEYLKTMTAEVHCQNCGQPLTVENLLASRVE